MRALQVLAGIVCGIGLLWLAITQYLGRPVYAALPPILEELPWSEDPAEPARVATALLVKPCKALATNTDLQVCLRTHGLQTGATGDEFWAKFEAGNGFSPDVHRLTWKSSNNELPMQMDAVKS